MKPSPTNRGAKPSPLVASNATLQTRLDLLGQGQRQPRRGGDLVHARLADRLDRAELADQRLLALGPDALYVVQRRVDGALAAQLAVERDCKAVRLIADPLHQVQALRVARQDDRLVQL